MGLTTISIFKKKGERKWQSVHYAESKYPQRRWRVVRKFLTCWELAKVNHPHSTTFSVGYPVPLRHGNVTVAVSGSATLASPLQSSNTKPARFGTPTVGGCSEHLAHQEHLAHRREKNGGSSGNSGLRSSARRTTVTYGVQRSTKRHGGKHPPPDNGTRAAFCCSWSAKGNTAIISERAVAGGLSVTAISDTEGGQENGPTSVKETNHNRGCRS